MALRQVTPIDRIVHELDVMARQISVMRRELCALVADEDPGPPGRVSQLVNPVTGKAFPIARRQRRVKTTQRERIAP